MSIQSYRELEVWQMAMDQVEDCYTNTRAFPKEELFGLTSQIRRAAISIPSNIAEGQGRNSTGEYVHFVGVANGSVNELVTQLLLSQRLGFLTQTEVDRLLQRLQRIGQMLVKLRQSLRKRQK